MSDNGHDLPWSAEQWAELQQLVQNSARKARIASSFLPLHGPLPPGQATVPALSMAPELLGNLQRGEINQRLEIDEGRTLRLTTIACDVYVTSVQAEDPSLAAVRDLLARAADVIGRLEDAIVFNGNATNAPPAAAGQVKQGTSPLVQPAHLQRLSTKPGQLRSPQPAVRSPPSGRASYGRDGTRCYVHTCGPKPHAEHHCRHSGA